MLLNDIIAGLRGVPVAAELREQAVRTLSAWWENPRYAAFRPQLQSLAERGSWNLLLDSFYRVMPFGTSGRRGPVGIGPNRINQDTVITSVQGHVNYLRRRAAGNLRVVIAFDVRVFRDLRRLYDPAQPNPLLGMRSRDFARLAAAVYAANGIEVYTVSGDDGFFMATPELSFAIRHLHARGGLNISASHNHPDDNGAKFYMSSGGQPCPPEDEELAGEVERVSDVPDARFDDALADGRIHWWDAALHDAYITENLSRSIDPAARRAVIAFTPLHGTGRHTVGDALPRAGFDVRFVQEQMSPDGEFPNVRFRMPNPEVAESMELVTVAAQQAAADAGFATDPDADRLGVVAPDGSGAWRNLSGNEIAVLLAAYIIEARRERGTLPPRGFMVKTAVTTALLTRIARRNGVQIVGDLLVGFKYIGEVLDAIETGGRFGEVQATLDDFLLGAEESNGVLVSAKLRDKDACGGALLLAELCARLRQQNRTLGDHLIEIYRRYGYVANLGYSIVMEGIAGLQRVVEMMQRLRMAPPPRLGDRRLERAVDFWDQVQFGPIRSETDRSSRNFVQLQYATGLRIAVRPSGTEPKIKFYVEQEFDPRPDWAGAGFGQARAAMDGATHAATLAFVDAALRQVGIALAPPGLLVSSLVSIDNRIDFCERFLPELEARLQAGADAGALAGWADERLKAYGADPRHLVKAAVAEHFRTHQLPAPAAGALRQAFFLP